MNIFPIAHIRTEFSEKFGIPRQSGLAGSLRGMIVFTPEYRNKEALRGLEGFSHLWLIWEFSANRPHDWQPTVRPPRLGGNHRMGVFATRSPFRPNPLGLSCVEIDHIESDSSDGPVIYVRGADLMDGTPIYDIKPYVEYADAHPNVRSGFVDENSWGVLKVDFPPELCHCLHAGQLSALVKTLSLDPRPQYHDNPDKEYGMPFAGYDVRFKVDGDRLTVIDLVRL